MVEIFCPHPLASPGHAFGEKLLEKNYIFRITLTCVVTMGARPPWKIKQILHVGANTVCNGSVNIIAIRL